MVNGSESTVKPCEHNDWDDVRTRHGFKVLRCRLCQGRWKLPSKSVNRCMDFLHNRCEYDAPCGLLHVRRKKTTLGERFYKFGECVLEGVAPRIQKKAVDVAMEMPPPLLCFSDSDDEGPPTLLDDDIW